MFLTSLFLLHGWDELCIRRGGTLCVVALCRDQGALCQASGRAASSDRERTGPSRQRLTVRKRRNFEMVSSLCETLMLRTHRIVKPKDGED